jgi:hypothetical protein
VTGTGLINSSPIFELISQSNPEKQSFADIYNSIEIKSHKKITFIPENIFLITTKYLQQMVYTHVLNRGLGVKSPLD